MNTKTLSLAAILLWAVTVAFIGYRFMKGSVQAPASAEETRTAIVLTAEEKAFVLSEMRMMLQSVQGVVDGLEQNNMELVSQAALESGTAHMVDMNPRLMMKLPMAFKKLGVGSHKYYDQISAEALGGASRDKIISMLNHQLQTCISCHDSYQFVVESK